MPLDQDARRYAETLFTDKLDQISVEHQSRVVATTNNFSSRGMLASGMYYAELARLGVEHVKAIGHAKVDSLIAAYELSKLPLDNAAAEEIIREALEWTGQQGAHVAKNVMAKASQAGMPDMGLAATVERQISGVQGEIRRKVARKALEAKFEARPVAAAPEPEVRDDLLPIFPRRQFDSDLPKYLETTTDSAPLALLMIDIDNFKQVNDTFQHHVGDEVLKGIASAVKSVCERKGRCYRFGGDELAVLLPNHEIAEAQAVAERLRVSVGRVKFERYPNQMTLSIGVATYPGSCVSRDELFQCADRAMYDAKQNGKNRVSAAGASEQGEGKNGINPYERFRLGILEQARSPAEVNHYICKTTWGLANEYGIPEPHVREELLRLAKAGFIELWSDAHTLFDGYFNIRLLSAGGELLSQTAKSAIGFAS